MRIRNLIRPALVAVFAALVLTAATNSAEGARRHTRLVKSAPAKDSVVAAPTSLQLWFNEKVDLGITRVRLADAAGAAVAVGPLTRADSADAPIVAAVMGAVPAGVYTVSWSTASKDGHPVRGTFNFTVKAAAGQ